MKQNEYKPWEVLPSELGPFYCEGIHDDFEFFRILVSGENNSSPVFRLLFKDTQLHYQSINESLCLNDKNRSSGLTQAGQFFIVENSWLLKWFHGVSSGIQNEITIKHYAMYLSNQIIDVLATQEPLVENLNE